MIHWLPRRDLQNHENNGGAEWSGAKRSEAERNGAQRGGALRSKRVSERVALLNYAVFSILDHDAALVCVGALVCFIPLTRLFLFSALPRLLHSLSLSLPCLLTCMLTHSRKSMIPYCRGVNPHMRFTNQ